MPKYTDINARTPFISKESNDVKDIKECVRHLILTNFGERFIRPEIGFLSKSLLFSLNTAETIYYFVTNITELFSRYEPRVELDAKNTTIVLYRDTGGVDLQLSLIIKGTEDQFELEVSI